VLLSFVASAYRSLGRIPYSRTGAAIAIAVVSLLGGSLDGLVLPGNDSVVILGMLVYEGRARLKPDRTLGLQTSGPG